MGPQNPDFHQPPSLLIFEPAGGRSRVVIESLPFHIGRQPENHLVLRDNRISRLHARIILVSDDYVIEDLNSRHGVYVNGVRVTRRKLHPSDRIEFGFADSYRLVFAEEKRGISELAERISSSLSLPGQNTRLARLRAITEVARALETAISTEDVLNALVDATLSITGAERGFLLLRKEEELEVKVARAKNNVSLQGGDLRVPRKLIQQALEGRRELLSMNFDPASIETSALSRTVVDLELRSVICLPLVRVAFGASQPTDQVSPIEYTVGVIYLDSRAGAADLSAGNRELLETLALEASTILENARLLEADRQRQRMTEELRIAQQIQASLLPKQLPATGWFRAAGKSIPTLQVGGDYFDAAQISQTCWYAVAADVSGKGVSAALLASLLQGIFLSAPVTSSDISRAIFQINRFLNERTNGESYATVFYAVLHRDGLLRYVNAGHCTPLLAHPNGILNVLPSNGFPIGMFEAATYEVREAHLAPEDKLLIYTDGLSEAEDPTGEFFGEQRIREVLRKHSGRGCQEIFEALEKAVENFTAGTPQRDDVTLLVVEYHPEA